LGGAPDDDNTRCLVTTFAGAAFDETFFWVSGAAAAITCWWNCAIAVLYWGLC